MEDRIYRVHHGKRRVQLRGDSRRDVKPHPDKNAVVINDSISIENDYLIFKHNKIALRTITGIKFGWLPIRVEIFRVGDRYLLEVNNQEQKLSINMRSYFGIRKDAQYEKFNYLLNEIWDRTVTRLFHETKDRIMRRETMRIGKCEINNQGIVYKDFLITWDDLLYQKYYNRLTLNSRSDLSIWTNLYYTETDNVHVLIAFLDWKFGVNSE